MSGNAITYLVDIFEVDGEEWVVNDKGRDGEPRKIARYFCVPGELFSLGDVLEFVEEDVENRGCECWINGIHFLGTAPGMGMCDIPERKTT